MRKSSLDNISCVAITTFNRALFYVQQKDESYSIPIHRLRYTFFGGSSERKENPYSTITRELNEELMPEALGLVVPNLIKLFQIKLLRTYLLPKIEYCMIHFYEAKLTYRDIHKLERYDVKEGKRGVVFSREELSKELFPESLYPLIDRYKQFW